MELNKKEKIKRSILIIIIVVIACVSIISSREKRKRKTEEKEPEQKMVITNNFNLDIIKIIGNESKNSNYLISPYNIELALNMLREGASGNTKKELDNLLGNRVINDLSVKGRIGIANGIFVKDDYKNNVKKDYYNILNTKYHSEVIYDKFTTPNKINNWVKDKTNGMIDKILNDMNKDFVMGLASALAIDVKWLNSFDCNQTSSGEFVNNKKENVEMMHKLFETNAKYFKTNDAEGIVIPYQKEDGSDVELEFVGILPNVTVDSYINNLTQDKIDDIFNQQQEIGENLHLNVSLPRFKYDYQPKDFIKVLQSLGLNEMFDSTKADFKKMIEIDKNVYVGEAIHKTHIELNEVGTKAAAITYFGMFKSTGIKPVDIKTIDIKFNKPFIYMIREKNTGEILFFGNVYSPNKWQGSTCSL